MSAKVHELSNDIEKIANILRGDFRQTEYSKIILPFTVMRRLDCVLESSKTAVLAAQEIVPEGADDEIRDMMLCGAVGGDLKVYNTSRFTFATLRAQEPTQVHDNVVDFVMGFSPNVRDILLEKFLFTEWLKRLKEAKLLFQIVDSFAQVDLHPQTVGSMEMGYVFEDLIRKFSELSNDTAGEHYTPREAIDLITDLLLINDKDALRKPGIIRTFYDPACGTGGMMSGAELRLKFYNKKARAELYGQELNGESYAIAKSDMLIKGHDADHIANGNTLTEDKFAGKKFHYMISNPPYGVDWKKFKDEIEAEAKTQGDKGRFGAGLPRVSDGQFLFIQHMISKMRDDADGSRIGIVTSGSPLFSGGAGSGESEIRRWIIENDWLEAIIQLPTDIFYNTGIQTYIWMLTNRKAPERRGKIQLIDASSERFWKPMKKSLGSKRRLIPDEAREEIVRIYGDFLNGKAGYGDVSKIKDVAEFGYREIRVERPLRLVFEVTEEALDRLREDKAFVKLDADTREAIETVLTGHMPQERILDAATFDKALDRAAKGAGVKLAPPVRKAIISTVGVRHPEAEIVRDSHGNPVPDTELRDTELVPMAENYRAYVEREVLPFVPDAWVDEGYRDDKDGEVGRVGCEINFNRYFFLRANARSTEEIANDIRALEDEISACLRGVLS